jgi:hypothetical protein
MLRSPQKDARMITRKYLARVTDGNKCNHALGHLLKETYITHSVRVGLYKTIIGEVVTYGVNSWTVTDKMKTALMT